jgi:hypothetical protein
MKNGLHTYRNCNILFADLLFNGLNAMTESLCKTFRAHHIYYSDIFLIKYARITRMNINRLTHARDDLEGIQSFYAQSVSPGRYMTTNFTPKASGVNTVSAEQHMLYPRDGYGYNNNSINVDSILRLQGEYKNNRCNIRAQARPFLTVPFMAGGMGNTDVESSLLMSEQVRAGKECGTVTEQAFDGAFIPMIPTLAKNVQNPENLIPEVASPGWIRGGLSSREYMRGGE